MKHLLVIAAMEEEEQALLEELGRERLEHCEVSSRLGVSAQRYADSRHTVWIARSGIGPVNAALTVASLVERHPIDAILLLGVGGALKDNLRIGDLVVSELVLQHDYFLSLDFGHPRVNPGELVFTAKEVKDCAPGMKADPALVRWVLEALPPGQAISGTVLSGNEFVGTISRKRALASLCDNALLVDMEAAGVAQIAQRLKIPFVVAKTVADRLQPDGTIEQDFRACLESASSNAAKVLRHLLFV